MSSALKSSFNNILLADQVALLYRAASFSNLFTLIIAGVFLTIQAPYLSPLQMLLWAGYTLFAISFRQLVTISYRRDKAKHLRAAVWRSRYLVCVALIAGIWGSAGLFITPDVSVANQVYTTFIVGGMVAGAITTLSAVLPAYILFALLSLAPLATHMLLHPDRIHIGIAVTIILYLAFLIVSARQMHRTITASLSLRYTRESEENLRQMANNSTDGILVLQDNDIVFMNNSLAEMADEATLERIITLPIANAGQRHFDLDIDDEDRPPLHWQVRCADTHWHGKPAALYTVRDVSAELVAKQAEQVSRAKSEFMSRMSHELRTPMNAILGFAQIMEIPASGELNEIQAKCVREIINSGHHLLDLITDLLDMSKIEANKIPVSLEDVDVGQCLQSVLAMFKDIPAERLQVDNRCNGHEPLMVRADPVRLRQVLTNLLSNADKYNSARGRITVTLDCDKEWLRIAIRDQGTGIDAATRQVLFKPFERGSAERTTIAGTGIGLYISRRLVELMGGEIGVDSNPGEGSSFWFTLPLTVGNT